MIISHKYKFIFIKTRKTAGTSIETYLSKYCGNNDIVTPVGFESETSIHKPRNYKGFFNPYPEFKKIYHSKFSYNKLRKMIKSFTDFFLQDASHGKFYNHIPSFRVKERIGDEIWDDYYKFTIERNPWDKTLSHYYMKKKSDNSLTFQDYIEHKDYCINYPLYMDVNKNKIIVDKIIKYENLAQGLTEVFNKINIPFNGTLGVQAKGKTRKDKRPYQKVYQNELKEFKDVIYDIYKKEIELHDYSFEKEDNLRTTYK